MEFQVVATDGGHLCLPVGRQGAHPLQFPPRLLQRLIPIDEGRANPLEGGGARRVLPFALLELVAQGSSPVRQPAVRAPMASASALKALHCSRSWRSSAPIWSKAPYLSRARCSSSCRQQTKTSERRVARNKREDDEIKESGQQRLTWKTRHAGPP
jgi:hypothetical protein